MCVLTSAPKRNKIHYMEKQLEHPSEHLRNTASSNHNYVTSLHQHLIEHRKQHGPSMEELAERAEWSVKKIETFERYDANPTLNDIARYATALEVRIQDIYKP
jgi:transcriptional regulator, XRE family